MRVRRYNTTRLRGSTQLLGKSEWDQKMGRIECVFRIDRQNEKKRRNGDRRAICNATRGIEAGHRIIRHRGVSDGSDGARPR